MLNRSTLLIDSFCYLVADKYNDEEAVKNFLKIHAKENINLNELGGKGLRVVEVAAQSGSMSTLRYLIEVCKVDISADQDTPNLVERALSNPPAREYLLNPEASLWHRFNDGTTDFLAHVMAGRLASAQALLEANPQQICDKNLRFQNALHWSHLVKQNLAWFKTRAETFLLQNSQPAHWSNLGRYYACMGHYKRLQYPNRPSAALMQFDLSIHHLKKALVTSPHPQESYFLKIDLATALLFSARLHLLMKSSNSDAAAHSIAASDNCLNEAIKLMRTLPKDLLHAHSHLFDSLLREHAENCFMLDDIFYATGDSLSHELLDAVDFYKKSVTWGEEAVRSADEITKKSAKDQAAMVKYCDKLFMSYGALVTCHKALSERDSPNDKFHQDECARYEKIASTFLNRTKEEAPSKFVPARVAPKALIKPISTHEGTNGALKSPQLGMFRLTVSPRLSSPVCGTLKGGDMPELFLPASLSALTT